jgi:peptidoglycan/LPS O-acetylase OafA/YrhL
MDDSQPAPRLSNLRMPALDGLRGLAILLVIPHNSSLVDGIALHGAAYPLKELLLIGWAGVQLFFVLSGFLITGALLDSQDASNYYSSFYARRALRILPLYYGMLIASFVILGPLGVLTEEMLGTAHSHVWLWTFLSNWTSGSDEAKGFSHFWSLAVEEQFYLLWPLALRRMSAPNVLRLGLAIAVAALVIRTGMRLAGSSPDALYEFTICRMDALALGAAAAAAMRMPAWQTAIARSLPRLPWIALVLFLAGVPLTHDYARTGFETQTWGQTMLAIIFTVMVLAGARPPDERPNWFVRVFSWGPLRSVGKYSYALYVFHNPLHKWVGLRLVGPYAAKPSATIEIAYAVALVLASYVIAWLSFHLYEQHFLRLKRYFVPEHTGPRRLLDASGA